MRFRFRLQKVLEHRRARLEAARRDVAALLSRLVELESQREAARRAREAWNARHREDAGTLFPPGSLQRRFAASRSLRAREHELWRREEELQQQVDAAREQLRELHREARVLERLRDKRLAQHQVEVRAQERREMDDIGGRSGENQPASAATPARRRR